MKPNKQAFTLIELLVVVLIIGILAAVAVPQYQKVVAKSRYTQLKTMAESLVKAEEIYYLANGDYSADFSKLDISLNATGAVAIFGDYRCMLHISNDSRVTCYMYLNNVSIGYTHYFLHSTHSAVRNCYANISDKNALQNQVCKSETGATTDEEDMRYNNNRVWLYQ